MTLVDANKKSTNMPRKAYKVTMYGYDNVVVDERYYFSLSKAKKVFKRKLYSALKNVDVATDIEEVMFFEGGKHFNKLHIRQESIRKNVAIPYYCGAYGINIYWRSIKLENITIE